MVKSKTKIGKQLHRKTSKELVETILFLKKGKNDLWLEVAGILSGPKRKQVVVNINQIDEEAKEGEKILVPGKVLSQGNINKKVKIVALGFSEIAKEKLLNAKCEISLLKDEIKKNPEAKGITILR